MCMRGGQELIAVPFFTCDMSICICFCVLASRTALVASTLFLCSRVIGGLVCYER